MIPFFRKLRKQLANDNKPLKYMRYAIGEIVLVVIGILIALSINNWNETQKQERLELRYLKDLKKELELNIKSAIDDNQFYEFQIQNAELIASYLSNDSQKDTEKLLVAIEHTGYGTALNFISDVWNELYSTGNISIIKNQEIKANLTELYRNFDMILKFEENEWGAYNSGYRRLVGDIIPLNLRLDIKLGLTPYSYSGSLKKLPPLEEIKDKLMNLKGLSGYLTDIIIVREVASKFLLEDIMLMKEISTQLQKEIESRTITNY